ncbi:MAG: UDP-GlcNAc:undecaprenyl-phosphate GlcNAc-1-phosphate transferase [Parvicellaceae bacterium]|jgi:UDP-GlcNAc:undecaprenyl-phosphate GlcNAc-1-phosphate transferase
MNYFIFLIPIVATYALLKLQIKFAGRLGLVDHPNARKLHKNIVPTSGGVVFVTVSLIGFVVFCKPEIFSKEMALLISTAILLVTGAIDDRSDLSYKIKFILQFFAVGLVVCSGYRIESLYGLFGIGELSLLISILISFVIGVGLINAVNFLDGIDGLCVTFSIGIFAILFFMNFESGTVNLPMLGWLTLSLLGFAVLNYSPAKIYMGDSGSLALGLLIYGFSISTISSKGITMNPDIFLIIGFLLVPILDAIRLLIGRILMGNTPFKADRNHLHHKLLILGFNHTQATTFVLLLALLIGVCGHYFIEEGLESIILVKLVLIYAITFEALVVIRNYRFLKMINFKELSINVKLFEERNNLIKNKRHGREIQYRYYRR